MKEKLQNIEEKLSILQNDLSSMSDELYNQQKDIQSQLCLGLLFGRIIASIYNYAA